MAVNVPLPRPCRFRRVVVAGLVVTASVSGVGAESEPETQPASGVVADDTSPARRPGDSERAASAVINEVLDRTFDFEVRNRPLPEVLELLRAETGVPFHVADATYAKLPYGRQTPISVNVRNAPLRRTIDAITQKLGLLSVLRDEAVEIRPHPAVTRVGRRTTVQEMSLMDVLSQIRIELVDDRPEAWQLLEAVDLRLQELDAAAREQNRVEPDFVVDVRLDERHRHAPVFVPRNASLLRALEALHEQSGATWYPSGNAAVALGKSAWVRHALDREVTLTYNRIDVQQVLGDLRQVSGVALHLEPGAIGRIPPDARDVRLFLEQATVRESLDLLGALTGLQYAVVDDGIYLWNQDPRAPEHLHAAASESPLLLVELGDGLSVPLYAGDVPDGVRRQVQEMRRQAVIRLENGIERPADQAPPTTQPAAGPP